MLLEKWDPVTQLIHDQFAKEYLSELLSPLGIVETSKEIRPEVRQIDLLFTPSDSGSEERKNLGLLGKLTPYPALFEPFRNPVTANEFAKEYLSELLSPLGIVETSKEVRPEVRQIDLLFTPSDSGAEERKNLGLLGKLTLTPALFEPFRNPVTANEIRSCTMKLFAVHGELEREAKRKKSSFDDAKLPQLWVLTPTASDNLLELCTLSSIVRI